MKNFAKLHRKQWRSKQCCKL